MQYLTGACGYDFGLSCKPGLCTVNDSLLALPRLQVEGSDTLEMFATKLKPDAEGALLKNPSNSRSAAL